MMVKEENEVTGSFISSASVRRAARRSLRLCGEVRANSRAVERPMPEEAPVMRMVLPERRLPMAVVDMVRDRTVWR